MARSRSTGPLRRTWPSHLRTWSAPREGAVFHEVPAQARDAEGVWPLVEGVRRLAVPVADGATPAQSLAEARVALGRVGGGLPRPPRAGRAGREGLEGRGAACQVRGQGRGVAAEDPHRRAGCRSRAEPGARRRRSDRGIGRRSILGGFLGRKSVSAGSITTVARGAGRVAQQRDDVERAGEPRAPAGPAGRAAGVVRSGRGRRRGRRRGHRATRLRRHPPQEGGHRRDSRDAGVRPALAGRGWSGHPGVLAGIPLEAPAFSGIRVARRCYGRFEGP